MASLFSNLLIFTKIKNTQFLIQLQSHDSNPMKHLCLFKDVTVAAPSIGKYFNTLNN